MYFRQGIKRLNVFFFFRTVHGDTILSNNSISGMVTRAHATYKLEVLISSFPKKSCATYMSHVAWGMRPFPALGNKWLTFHVSLQNPVCPQAFPTRRHH